MHPSIMLQFNKTYSCKSEVCWRLGFRQVTTYNSGMLQSNPEVAGQPGPTFHSIENGVLRHNQVEVQKLFRFALILRSCSNQTWRNTPVFLQRSKRDNLSIWLDFNHQMQGTKPRRVKSPGLDAQTCLRSYEYKGFTFHSDATEAELPFIPVHGLPIDSTKKWKATLFHMACNSVVCFATSHFG